MSKGTLFFEIPNDQETMVKLVEAVPDNWAWVDGGLFAPKDLIALGQVEENTGFVVERFHSIHPTIIGSYDENERRSRKPDLFAIMVEQKLPGFIIFNEAGYDAGVVTLELTKRLAVGFLRKGYRGGLHFYKDCYDNHKYENPARCDLVLQSGDSIFRGEQGPQPARARLEWNVCYGGREEDIASIAAVCRSLGLREYALPLVEAAVH